MELKMIFRICGWICLCLLLQVTNATASSKEFPGRDLYPKVPVISLADLKASMNNVVIVDVRSTYEYKTLHIEGAKNIPVAGDDFVASMEKLRGNTEKPIIVYCNGKTCMKSYKAAYKCQLAKIPDVTAFDAGIMDWAKKNPDHTLLLGRPLRDPKKLISKAKLHSHMISPDKFGDRVAETDDIVLDVRDRFQREGISLFVGREHRVYLDDKKRLDRYLNKAMQEHKGVLIYDAAGKQVRWLQYHLEDKGMKNYHFMEGGIRKYYKAMEESNYKSASSR